MPKISFFDKVLYAIWKGLFRDLIGKKIVDDTGMLMSARAVKPLRAKPRTTYKKLVSVNGFSWSGSSAVADLLQEYKGVTSSFAGTLDDPPEVRNQLRFEFDLVRGAGGLYALEHAFATRNIFERDAAIRLFMQMAFYDYVNVKGFYGPDFVAVTRKFVKDILAAEVKSPTGFDYCRHMSAIGTHSANFILGHDPNDRWQYLYYLKDLTPAEYRKKAAAYLHEVLNLVEADDYLLMDQGTADGSSDVRRFKEFFGNLKMIYVWRDPRDVFTVANEGRQGEGYIPDKVEDFVRWYKMMVGQFDDVQDDSLMLIRFEDLVISYDVTTAAMEKFLGLSAADHVSPLTRFIPSMSFDWGVGRWKKYENQDDIKYIEQHLAKYCYPREYVRPAGPAPDRNLDA